VNGMFTTQRAFLSSASGGMGASVVPLGCEDKLGRSLLLTAAGSAMDDA
jgi:hypothetical protein